MKYFGYLSFGHHAIGHQSGPDAGESLTQAVELARRADAIGVNGAYFRVHHFAPQHSSPMSLLGAVAGATENLEVGTGVIDMRYENPLHLAEEAATLDLVSRGRVALGVSRGSPEPARRGWEAFGYTAEAPDGRDMARQKFLRLLAAADGEAMAVSDTLENQYPQMYHPGVGLPVFPQSPTLRRRIWWGAGSHATAEQAAHDGVNLMSSTLVSEADGSLLGDLQAEQIERYRTAWKAAGHPWTPRVSVSRSVFPIVTGRDRELFGTLASGDQVGSLGEGVPVTFGGTYAADPDKLIEQLRADAAVMSADTLMLTIPNPMGVEVNAAILENFARHVAGELGWRHGTPATDMTGLE